MGKQAKQSFPARAIASWQTLKEAKKESTSKISGELKV
jgi:hypothetical protein